MAPQEALVALLISAFVGGLNWLLLATIVDIIRMVRDDIRKYREKKGR